ncbi:dihydroxyacetone kinase subunit DhaL [Conyzicola nivalis]|uniref:Dihydroxyacetone kinase subunit L n=1 Tax=Conyzicola nivalis TaxID=1477021 RepID=A0A916SLB1_9MICO|nr:dihydroxyacetone kinase subunit DhaL [Conyzicola nivalis]GGB05657.1 dihydroxyacetone kinase subunit L [Conyzicola nivalis]
MATTATVALLTDWLERFRAAVVENQSYLTELDSAIGDADHGSNMARGMTAVVEKAGEPATVDALFRTVGMTLVSTVGGASGPLYGTFFLRFGTTAGAVETLDGPALSAALHAGLAGVLQRGNAEVGDKTMVDALTPALAAFDASLESGGDVADATRAAADAAAKGRDATEPLVARKGRASYLGDRSAGHLDPGATSTALLFEALAAALA